MGEGGGEGSIQTLAGLETVGKAGGLAAQMDTTLPNSSMFAAARHLDRTASLARG